MQRKVRNYEGILDLYEVLYLPFSVTVMGGVVYLYNLIMHAATP